MKSDPVRSIQSSRHYLDEKPENEIGQTGEFLQQKLERQMYLTTRDIFQQTLFKSIVYLGSGAAFHILRRQVKEFPTLVQSYKVDDLVGTLVKMHAQGVYRSTEDEVKKKWPWLLKLDLNNLPAFETYYSDRTRKSSNFQLGSAASEPNSSLSATNLGRNKRFPLSQLGSRLILDDSDCSMASFETTNETANETLNVDPYSTYFPYPTQRKVLKETQRTLKMAIYEFTKKYLPEKLLDQLYEYPASSSLGQWVLMIQDAISNSDTYRSSPSTLKKLTYLATLNPNLLDSASEVHDLVSNRQNASTYEIYVLLATVLEFIDALGVLQCSAKQKRLNEYTSTLAVELKKKLEEIQDPLRNTLRHINKTREKLKKQEEDAIQKYRQSERVIQKTFLLDQENLRSVVQTKGKYLANPSLNENTQCLDKDTNGFSIQKSNLVSFMENSVPEPPSIYVWGPDDELVDYRPGGTRAIETVKEVSSSAICLLPWDMVSIDRAIEKLNEKENIASAPRKATDNFVSNKPTLVLGDVGKDTRTTANIALQPKPKPSVPFASIEPTLDPKTGGGAGLLVEL
ncbi:hypothetical protein H072_9453 [Dactylellina haptotyla CBS 200.50]|uniref:Uncharacterized protein n=1 Tax=Dactylellina haptotyla (strain CBS 200.50) TaxID=1284197 RepID=S8A1W5_DACHA|nr:hypothetical protein H072_9453 [Dactylellina haptotyla CBS 200.50]